MGDDLAPRTALTNGRHIMTHAFVRPCDDILFKHIFADRRDTKPLRGFLAATLDLPEIELDQITIEDPQVHPHEQDAKTIIFDIRLTTATGREIEVEIQLVSNPDFPKRLAYYTSSMLANQLKHGEDYQRLRQAITIAITDFELTGHDDNLYHHRFHLNADDNPNICLTDVLEIDLLEIPKLPKQPDGTLLWPWLRFIGAVNQQEMQQAMMLDTTIYQAGEKAREFTDDGYDAWVARRKLVTEFDAKSYFEHGHNQGLAEGRTEGMAEGRTEGLAEGARTTKLELARAMLAKGLPPETVAELAQLTLAEVTHLQQH